MIKDKLKSVVETAVQKAIAAGKLGALSALSTPIVIEKPRLAEHGDLACGVALKLASAVRSSPLKIAEAIAADISVPEIDVSRFEVAAPGFINFRLGTGWLCESLKEISKLGADFGRSNLGAGQKVLVEYVSANPTGDLHIGHGRGAVYGSCLSNLLAFTGHEVEQEFYINDTGEQIAQLGRCAWACYQRKLGQTVDYPEGGYPEVSIVQFIETVIGKQGDQHLNLSAAEGEQKLAELTKEVIIDWQRKLLLQLKIEFNCWYSELSLHERGAVEAVLEQFSQRGMSYESEGALWLKAKELGDERDRVLKKSAGNTTYLAADAAYHLDKFKRGYDRLITIWGADHHGQVPGLKAAVEALGQDPEKLEVILTQIVNLQRDGQMVRMSKRMGTVVTLDEVMEEVGADAVRYYLAESNPQNPINFDLELAKQTSRENPAFYIQYAHARCCAILRRALEPTPNAESGRAEQPLLSPEQWAEYLKEYQSNASVFEPLFDLDSHVFIHQKSLIMRLQDFCEEVEEAMLARMPGRLARYAYDVANDLQRFYESCRVITSEPDVTKARLGLIVATRQVLANVLGIIGVSAPERM
jgi:arginyl-tRNA synthetase